MIKNLNNRYNENKKLEIENRKKELVLKNENKKLEQLENKVQNLQLATNKFISEKIISFPWLALMIAEYKELQDEKIAFHLEVKSHPAKKAAEKVREIKNEKKEIEKNIAP